MWRREEEFGRGEALVKPRFSRDALERKRVRVRGREQEEEVPRLLQPGGGTSPVSAPQPSPHA